MTSTTSRRAEKMASNAMLSRYHASIAYHVSKIMRDNPPPRRGAPQASSHHSNESNSSPVVQERGPQPSAQRTTDLKAPTYAPPDDARSRKPSQPPQSVTRSKPSRPSDPPTQRTSRVDRAHLDHIQEVQPERKSAQELSEPGYPEKTDFVAKWLANVDHSYIPCQSPAISTLYADPEVPVKNDTAIHIVYNG